MSTPTNPYPGFRFPAAIINEAAWLCHCCSLSLREVELILAARGIEVSYETIREWGLRFGRDFANTPRRRRPGPGDKRFLDEVFIRIRGSGEGLEARQRASAKLPPELGAFVTLYGSIQTDPGRNHKAQFMPFDFIGKSGKSGTMNWFSGFSQTTKDNRGSWLFCTC